MLKASAPPAAPAAATESEQPQALADALELAKLRYKLLPVHGPGCALSGKSLVSRLAASRDPRRLRQWWSEWPHAAVGVPTDRRQDVFAVRVAGTLGERTLLALEREHGELLQPLFVVLVPAANLRTLVYSRGACFMRRQSLGPGLSALRGGARIVDVLRRGRHPGLALPDLVVMPALSDIAVPS
jgi:hypothetical protein